MFSKEGVFLETGGGLWVQQLPPVLHMAATEPQGCLRDRAEEGRVTQGMGRLPQQRNTPGPGQEWHSRLPGEEGPFPSPGLLYSNLGCKRGLTGCEKKRY